MVKVKIHLIIFPLIVFLFSISVFSQNFDYELQNSLERVYLNSENSRIEDFNIFRKTFFCEGYSSFDYLHAILRKNKKLVDNYPLFFQKVDTTQFDIYKKSVKKMVSNKKYMNAWVFSMDTFVNYLTNLENFIPFVLNCFSNNYMVIFYFLAIFGFISLLRFIRLLMSDIKRFLERKNLDNFLALYVVLFVVLFFPLFLTIHLKYLPIYWIVLFFIYTSFREKVIVYTALVLLLVVSFVGIYLTSFAKNFYKENIYYYESLTYPFSGVSIEKKNDKSDLANFTKGISLLRGGNPVESIKYLKDIKTDSRFYSFALNNIGVAYILLSRPKLALNFFDEAIKNGLKFEPNINKFYLNNKLYNIVESEEALKSAFSANSLKTTEWLNLNIKEPFPVISVPSFKEVLATLFNQFSLSKTHYSIKIQVFILVLLLILIMIHFVSRDMSITRGCKKCGTPFKVFESQNDKLCTQCALMLKNKSELSNEMKEIKRKEIRLYSTVKRAFEIGLGLIFPGFYNICILQKVFSGLAIFLVFFILLLDSVKAYKVAGNIVVISPLLVMLIMVYLINVINIFFESEED